MVKTIPEKDGSLSKASPPFRIFLMATFQCLHFKEPCNARNNKIKIYVQIN